MGYTVRVEDDVVVVKLFGVFSTCEGATARREGNGLACRLGLTRILADISETTATMGTLEVYEMCSALPEELPAGAKLAVVHAPTVQAKNAEFAELVSLNRGVVLRAFPEIGPAQRWLAEN